MLKAFRVTYRFIRRFVFGPAKVFALLYLTQSSILMLYDNFKRWGLLDQTLGVSLVAGLFGIFFGLWIQNPIRRVLRDYRRNRRIQMLGVFIPWPLIFRLTYRVLLHAHSWQTAALFAGVIATPATIVFWVTAVLVRNNNSRPKKFVRRLFRGISGATSNFPNMFTKK